MKTRARPKKRRSAQITLDETRKPSGRGGWRPGAGRPRGRKKCAHIARPKASRHHPHHVTLRFVDEVGSLRREPILDIVRAAIEAAGHRDDFRVIHFNMLGNHLHLINEAENEVRLSRGMQGLMVRLARRINKYLGRSGTLFRERYHERALRNAIRYVLLNGRHHAAERGQRLGPTWVDPYSSALWFDGWSQPIHTDVPWLRKLRRRACPTAAPRTWLLTLGWRRHGLIAIDEVPG